MLLTRWIMTIMLSFSLRSVWCCCCCLDLVLDGSFGGHSFARALRCLLVAGRENFLSRSRRFSPRLLACFAPSSSFKGRRAGMLDLYWDGWRARRGSGRCRELSKLQPVTRLCFGGLEVRVGSSWYDPEAITTISLDWSGAKAIYPPVSRSRGGKGGSEGERRATSDFRPHPRGQGTGPESPGAPRWRALSLSLSLPPLTSHIPGHLGLQLPQGTPIALAVHCIP